METTNINFEWFIDLVKQEPRKIVDVIRDLHGEYEPVTPVNPE